MRAGQPSSSTWTNTAISFGVIYSHLRMGQPALTKPKNTAAPKRSPKKTKAKKKAKANKKSAKAISAKRIPVKKHKRS